MDEGKQPMAVPEHWTFKNREVADRFDEHVREQLPWYDMVTRAVAHYVEHYLPEGGLMYDIGASNGNIGRACADIIERRKAQLFGIEPSKEMCETYAGPGQVVNMAAEQVDYQEHHVSVMMLTMMFIAPSLRIPVLQRIASKLQPGGALIVVDRTQSLGGEFGTATWRLTLNEKVRAGARLEDVMRKELSLAGVQRPIPYELMPRAGAKEFFRFGDFAGWVIEA